MLASSPPGSPSYDNKSEKHLQCGESVTFPRGVNPAFPYIFGSSSSAYSTLSYVWLQWCVLVQYLSVTPPFIVLCHCNVIYERRGEHREIGRFLSSVIHISPNSVAVGDKFVQ